MINRYKLKLEISDEKTFKLKVLEKSPLKLSINGIGIPVYPKTYEGKTNIVPAQTPQIIKTSGMMMLNDITVDKIPNCYGLITWNGSFIKVS